MVFCSFSGREISNMLPWCKFTAGTCCSEGWESFPGGCWPLSALILINKIFQKLGEVMESLKTMKQRATDACFRYRAISQQTGSEIKPG